ncbi:hypothetical protein [Sphaerisporangium sp. NPDC051011]|uniref:hypothetical protein n=1 Tax=Sphaerisporangium sp. NPDC051011 TaxID=3155792 RepID=UPI0033E76C4F
MTLDSEGPISVVLFAYDLGLSRCNRIEVEMDIAALTTFLAPLLPYLVKAGEKFGDAAAEQVGQETFGFAQRIWSALRGKVGEKPAAQEAVADVAEDPDDEDLRTILRIQLKRLLAEDPELTAEVERLWRQAPAAAGVTVTNVTASGTGSVAIGRDATSSTITTGGTGPVD